MVQLNFMRACVYVCRLHRFFEWIDFLKYLLKLVNGELPLNTKYKIELQEDIISSDRLPLRFDDKTFRNFVANSNYDGMKDRDYPH